MINNNFLFIAFFGYVFFLLHNFNILIEKIMQYEKILFGANYAIDKIILNFYYHFV